MQRNFNDVMSTSGTLGAPTTPTFSFALSTMSPACTSTTMHTQSLVHRLAPATFIPPTAALPHAVPQTNVVTPSLPISETACGGIATHLSDAARPENAFDFPCTAAVASLPNRTAFQSLDSNNKLNSMFDAVMMVVNQNSQMHHSICSIEARMNEFTTMINDHETRLKDLEDRVARVYIGMAELRESLSTQPLNYETTAEFIISGLPCESAISDSDIVTRIMKAIGAERFLGDVINVNRVKARPAFGAHPAPASSFSLIINCKSVQVRNEIMRLKISKGDLPATQIFPNLSSILEKKLYLNEWLPPRVYKLLLDVRARARRVGYERVWVRNGTIFVRKNASADRILIGYQSDLAKML